VEGVGGEAPEKEGSGADGETLGEVREGGGEPVATGARETRFLVEIEEEGNMEDGADREAELAEVPGGGGEVVDGDGEGRGGPAGFAGAEGEEADAPDLGIGGAVARAFALEGGLGATREGARVCEEAGGQGDFEVAVVGAEGGEAFFDRADPQADARHEGEGVRAGLRGGFAAGFEGFEGEEGRAEGSGGRAGRRD
jgi:hypothetical protein